MLVVFLCVFELICRFIVIPYLIFFTHEYGSLAVSVNAIVPLLKVVGLCVMLFSHTLMLSYLRWFAALNTRNPVSAYFSPVLFCHR